LTLQHIKYLCIDGYHIVVAELKQSPFLSYTTESLILHFANS